MSDHTIRARLRDALATGAEVPWRELSRRDDLGQLDRALGPRVARAKAARAATVNAYAGPGAEYALGILRRRDVVHYVWNEAPAAYRQGIRSLAKGCGASWETGPEGGSLALWLRFRESGDSLCVTALLCKRWG